MATIVLSDNTGADYTGTGDVALWQGIPTTNTNTFGALSTSKYSDFEHSLVRFTSLATALAAIPGGDVITDAYIELWLDDGGTGATHTITVRRMLVDWDEAQATWNERLTGTAWGTAGATGAGDRSGTTSATGSVPVTTGQYYQFTGAQLIQDLEDLRDAITSNYGWHFERTDGSGDLTYRTWEDSEGTDGHRPRLVITHTPNSQLEAPDADVTDGAWVPSTGTDLFAVLDESAASDADYASTTSLSMMEVGLANATDPAVSTGHIVRYRISATNSKGMVVRLMQGTTVIASWTHSALAATLTTYVQTLTAPQADSITDYTNLRLQFEATA